MDLGQLTAPYLLHSNFGCCRSDGDHIGELAWSAYWPRRLEAGMRGLHTGQGA